MKFQVASEIQSPSQIKELISQVNDSVIELLGQVKNFMKMSNEKQKQSMFTSLGSLHKVIQDIVIAFR